MVDKPEHPAPRLLAVQIAVPPAAAAVLGLAHPYQLTAATAREWLVLHIVLLFVAPLIALGPVSLCLRTTPDRPILKWASVTTGAVYAICYPTLDVLAGIATGQLVYRGIAADGRAPDVLALQAIAQPFGTIGVGALVACTLLAGYAVQSVAGRAAYAGVLLSVVGAWGLGEHHVYWPHGTVSMLCFSTGQWLLARLISQSQPVVGQPPRAGERR
ncbi:MULTISPECIES: hypothetical protein [Micromonospora]|uniref:hypothetical protein n=1 Tax=Micromonospora TaxID=1873 RepID=UPI000AE6CB92|nr:MULTISPECIES: hypothetical protein [unclassified Micromonospora]MDG4756203.1 hypothetical protein [Micromonospora sp. WMMD718]